jgi:predicted amino acid dehydrogenase
MKTFAFLLHPLNIHQVKSFWPLTRILPISFVKPYLKHCDFKILALKKIKSKQGREIQGYLIVCPLLPEDMEELTKLDEELILDKIISAGYVAERLGAKLMGLGGYLGIIADKKPMIYKHLNVPLTSGSTYTAWSIFEAIYKTAKQKRLDLKKLTLAVVGPITGVSSLCARKFSEHVAKIILTGESEQKLQKLKNMINQLNSLEVEITPDVSKAIKEADIIINTHGSDTELFNIADLKPQSIVCDVSVFQIIAEKAKQRKDITFIESGIIKLPKTENIGLNLCLHENMIYASIAEIMLLALEERLVNYSLGENINLDKLEDIANIAVQHGFEVCEPGT